MDSEILSGFIDDILDDDNGVQLDASFDANDPHEDLKCTFFSFLISRCILRYAPGYASGSEYKFSKPGRAIMGNNAKRIEFIDGFLTFYSAD